MLKIWDQDRQDYHRSFKKAEIEALEQVTNTHTLIRKRIRSKKLLEDPEIAYALTAVELILSGKEGICLQPH